MIPAGYLAHPLSGAVMLWPIEIYGPGLNKDLSGALQATPVMFGGRFLLYGFVWLTVRLLVHVLRLIAWSYWSMRSQVSFRHSELLIPSGRRGGA